MRASLARGRLPLLIVFVLSLAACGSSPGASPSSAAPGAADASAARSPSASGPGATESATPAERLDLAVSVGGRERRTALWVPPGAGDEPLPLLVFLHARGSNPTSADRESRLAQISVEEGYLVAAPFGVESSWNAGVCCGAAVTQEVDDVAFIDAVLETVAGEHAVDPTRTYAAGMSNGSVMADRLACEAADRFVAVVIVAGADWGGPCTPSRPVSVLVMHGTEDNTFAYDGAVDLAARWRELDGCAADPAAAPLGEGATSARAEGCAEGTVVELISIEGAPHQWFPDPSAREALTTFLRPIARD